MTRWVTSVATASRFCMVVSSGSDLADLTVLHRFATHSRQYPSTGTPRFTLRKGQKQRRILVGDIGIEPTTLSMSRKCSTAELVACMFFNIGADCTRKVWQVGQGQTMLLGVGSRCDGLGFD